MMTHDEAQTALRDLCENDFAGYIRFRQAIIQDASRTWPEGDGMGSGDISVLCIQALQDLDGDVAGFLAGTRELPVYGS